MRLVHSCLLVATIGGGCAQHDIAAVVPNDIKEEFKDIPVSLNRDVDILFVIDNSVSMDQEQTSLTANFYNFISVLEDIEGGLPNVHIGVASSDVGADPNIGNCEGVGDNGTLQTLPRIEGCQAPNGAFIRDIRLEDGSRSRNYPPEQDLADTFACIAGLGTKGCGFEMHLESMKRALNGANPTNQGFLRKDAYLAVVFIADEDDCSTEDRTMFGLETTDELGPLSSFRCFEFGVTCDPDDDPRAPGPRENCVPRDGSAYMYDVQEYVDFIKGLKDDPSLVIVAGIIGDSTPVSVIDVEVDGETQPELDASCTSDSGIAAPAVRLRYFLEQFPQRNTVTTICDSDLSGGLQQIAELLATVIGNPCLEGAMVMPPECRVSDVHDPGTNEQVETVIPICATVPPSDAELPCWHLDPDERCTTPTGLSLIVERGEDVGVPNGTHVWARCLLEQ